MALKNEYKFKPGDIVFCIETTGSSNLKNTTYKVKHVIMDGTMLVLEKTGSYPWYKDRFILANDVAYLDILLLSSD